MKLTIHAESIISDKVLGETCLIILILYLIIGSIHNRNALAQCYQKAKIISFLTLGVVCIAVIAIIVSIRSYDQSTDRNDSLKKINRRHGRAYQGRKMILLKSSPQEL